MDLKKVLQDYGLALNEATLYLACLEVGPSSTYRISKKTNIPRSTCYEVLGDLQKQGYVTSFQKKRVLYYRAEQPKTIIKRKQERIISLEKSLPYFEAFFDAAQIYPSVRMYDGTNGIKLVLHEILDEAHEILGISSAEDHFEVLGEYWPQFLEKRIKKKIPVRALITESEKAMERQEAGIKELRQVRLLPPQYKHHGLVMIWRDKVAIFSLKDAIHVFIIEGKITMQIFQSMFEYMWDTRK